MTGTEKVDLFDLFILLSKLFVYFNKLFRNYSIFTVSNFTITRLEKTMAPVAILHSDIFSFRNTNF